MSTSAQQAPADLAGRMQLFPGAAAGQPAIVSTRPDIASALLRGRPATQAPELLGAVFTLCAHAHRWTAKRAISAALAPRESANTALPPGAGQGAEPGQAEPGQAEPGQAEPGQAEPGQAEPGLAEARQTHRLATLREHLLRISHDWPCLLPGAPAAPDAALVLRACPVWRNDLPPEQRLEDLPAWLMQHWLGGQMSRSAEPAQALLHCLRDWEAGGEAWLDEWLRSRPAYGPGATPLMRLLQSQRTAMQALAVPGPTLSLTLNSAPQFAALAQQMASAPGFCAQPHWQGQVPDTGPWARQGQPSAQAGGNAWQRLTARLLETLRLATPGGERLLAHGELNLGAGRGLAWTEMARGLLVHHVQLDTNDAPQARIAQWQVLAPTEWNFHHESVLAQALRQLPAASAQGAADAARLAVAFDPCVAFEVPSHA